MTKEYEGFAFNKNAKRGYGRAHLVITDKEKRGINIGRALNEYQHSAYPDGDADEIISFFDEQDPQKMVEFINKYGDYSSCTAHVLWSWEKFKEMYRKFTSQ